jgi:K(+)-stimulated pyrophosphate-energized sodium pump
MNWIHTSLLTAVGASAVALVYSAVTAFFVMRQPDGNTTMKGIAQAIQEGANAYLFRQYKTIALVGLCVAALFMWSASNMFITWGFILGSTLSGISGYCGMIVSVRANVRTTHAASTSGLHKAFSLAFRSGAVTGFLVNGLGLISIAGYMWYMNHCQASSRDMIEGLLGLGFGASLISIFARLGGGIFTKGADVGADLVGKVEAGIPEDDPRNAAVIADNVGDNVGDCAGMSADLFETYVVTLVACIQIALFQTPHLGKEGALSLAMMPLIVGSVLMVGCLLGTFFVRLKKNIMNALYKGLGSSMIISSALITLVAPFMPTNPLVSSSALLWCVHIGMIATAALVWITEYYTSTEFSPVRSIAKASETGHGTNVIQGLAISMESCVAPTVVVAASLAASYWAAGLMGVALSSTAMLSLMGMIIAIDAYGPITDNAGGIAEMAGLPEKTRQITDALDAVGNTTKAVTKGYAIGAAALAALVLFSAYTQDVSHYLGIDLQFDLGNHFVIMGLLVGSTVPYLFSALSMKAVSRAGAAVVEEVRHQFKTIAGIMDYTTGQKSKKGRPDYGKAVDILTKASIKSMVVPSLLPVVVPAAVLFLGKALWSAKDALVMMGGVLMGLTVTGFFLAVSMTSGGGAWDNAKKYIELGNHGGKNSDAHKASVTGDTVGDPYKDTAGPAINPLIKIANLAALLLLMLM